MIDAEQPDGTAEEETTARLQLLVPTTGVDAQYTAALSHMITSLQRSIAPALRVRIPAIPASAYKLPQIQMPVIPSAYLDSYRQFAAGVEPVLRAQREQLTRAMAGVATALQRLFPENWYGVTGRRLERLESILLDEASLWSVCRADRPCRPSWTRPTPPPGAPWWDAAGAPS